MLTAPHIAPDAFLTVGQAAKYRALNEDAGLARVYRATVTPLTGSPKLAKLPSQGRIVASSDSVLWFDGR